MGKVVVVGSSNADMVFTTDRMPPPGETVIGQSFEVIQGGKGANQAVAAARAGAEVVFIAKVGDDDLGIAAIEGYQKDGIHTHCVTKAQGSPTGVAMIMVDQHGENSIVVTPGANGLLTPNDIDKAEEEIKSADVLLVQLEIPHETVFRALELAKTHQVKTILNPAPAQTLDEATLKLIDYITPNETETHLLTGILPQDATDSLQAASTLFKHIPQVIITRGSKGAFYAKKGGRYGNFPTPKVKPLDTTAAGDVFNGYFASCIARGNDLEDAIQLAIKAASLSVTRKGAQPSVPYFEELNA